MKSTQLELTDMGNRALLRELSWELTDAKVKELVEQYASRLTIDQHDEYVIKIDGADILMSATKVYSLWIESHHVEKIVVNEEDGSDE
jgi:hypothetical protein